MRGRQQLVAIRSTGEALVVESLRYADEVVDVATVMDPDAVSDAKDKEVKMARAFLESLEVDFDPSRYVDEYQQQLQQLIERKVKDGDIAVQPDEAELPASTPVDDIMAALEASLATQRESRGSGAGSQKQQPAKRRRASASASARRTAKR